jgi:hypothetical protein
MELIPAAAEGTTPPAETVPTPTPSSDFDQLLQGFAQTNPPVESALPELLAVVASLAGSSNLLEGLAAPPKEKKAPAAGTVADVPQSNDPLATMEALRGIPQICFQLPAPAPVDSQQPADVTPQATSSPAEAITAPIDIEPKPELPAKPLLNLKDFDVRRFEFKTELEIATVQPRLIRVSPLPGVLGPQPKPAKSDSSVADVLVATPSSLDRPPDAPLIAAPEAVERVRVSIEPPPPPAVARQVSMDIGEAGSEVRVVIRERGGELAVQFGAASERLKEDLQNAAPLLMHELRRDREPTNAITLDFSSFGSATDAGHDAQHDSPRKKFLKSEAVFADMDETAYLEENTPSANSF